MKFDVGPRSICSQLFDTDISYPEQWEKLMTLKYIDFVAGEDAREIAENVAEVLKIIDECCECCLCHEDIIKQLTGEHYDAYLYEKYPDRFRK